jgi:hypothetical protein
VVDVLRRIGTGREFVGAGDGDQMDVDLHTSLQIAADGERRRGAENGRGRDQRLRDGERRRLMAIFAIDEYVRETSLF